MDCGRSPRARHSRELTEPGDKFGSYPTLTMGVEEELMIIDPETLDLFPGVQRIRARAESYDLPGPVKTELHASIFELNTPPCLTAQEAAASLTTLRHGIGEVVAAEGLAFAAAGCHPFARALDQEIVDDERYQHFVSWAGVSAQRQGVQGLHVHLSMPNGETCWSVLEGMLQWLPVVLALSANSPWFEGVQNGVHSNRAEILLDLPRTGAPPPCGSYAGWELWANRLIALGIFEDATRLWWDVRPNPHLGTIEVRIADQQTVVRRSAAFAALIQALAATIIEAGPGVEVDPSRRGDYHHNRWAASHYGPLATLIHPSGNRVGTAAELGAELLELVAPAAATLGSTDLIAVIDPETCEADIQSACATPREVAADLVARSVA